MELGSHALQSCAECPAGEGPLIDRVQLYLNFCRSRSLTADAPESNLTRISTELPEELITALKSSPAQVFCHEIVMDAIDLSMALDRHLLLYGLEGLFLLESDDAIWRLPPTRVAWIPSGTKMTATTIRQVRCTSLFLQPGFGEPLADECRIFEASPVVREMIIHARRWSTGTRSIDHDQGEGVARFFLTLLDLCREQLKQPYELALPKARTPETERALRYIRDHLADPIRLEDVAEHAAMSPRTLQRRLSSEIHMPWGDFVRHARMLRAMEHLARGRQVTETTFEVGYTGVAAFSTAFHRFTGMTPSEYVSKF